MTTFFVLLLIAAVVAFVLTKKSVQPIKLVGNVKKVETPVVKIPDVTVVEKDVVVTEVIKKVRKPRAKKITTKKKK